MKSIHETNDQEGQAMLRQLFTMRNDAKILENLQKLVNELRITNSTNAKIESIKRYPELKDLLWMIYSPDVRFHLSSNSLSKSTSFPQNHSQNSLFELLKSLAERRIVGNESIAFVNNYIYSFPEHGDLIKSIIDKNLKARIGFNLLKAAFGEDDPVFEFTCALGFSVEKHLEYLKKSLERHENWCISRKFDGIRVFVAYDSADYSLQIYNRNKKLMKGLNPSVANALKTDLCKISGSFVFDGELVYIGNEGRENFSETVSMVKSLEPKTCAGLEFHVFDRVDASDESFLARFENLKSQLGPILGEPSIIRLVDQKVIDSISDFDYENLKKEAVRANYEGFIIRRDCELKDGRSRDFLKIKPFQDAEFKVTACEIGPMRVLNEKGEDVSENLLLSISIDFGGHGVNVGSGFTISQRREFARDPSQIIGKIVTIRYQSECFAEGRDGKSLRFPVFKHLHGNFRTE